MAYIEGYKEVSQTVAIANGQTTSATVNAAGYSSYLVTMPAAFTGTALSFLVSVDNSTFNPLYTVGNVAVSLTVAASRNYVLPAELAPYPYFQIVSNASEGGARSLIVMLSAGDPSDTSALALESGGNLATVAAATTSGVAIKRTQLAATTLTIASSGTVSGAIDTQGYTFFALVMPAAFTGTALTFQTSHDNTTFQALYDTANNQVTLATVAASRNYDLPPELSAWRWWKIVSGSSEGASRSLIIVGKG